MELLPPNKGQQEAIDAFFKFMLDPREKRHILSGPGGVGKTFTMGHMIDNVMPEYIKMCELMGVEVEYDTVEMTATTNKAVEQLERATGRPCKTIQSFLGLRVKENFKTGEVDLIRTNNWQVHTRKVIFIDECSMISRDLFDEIQAATSACKVVFVGDHVQLPPVRETLSEIYSKGYKMSQLTQPMRTDIPELQALNAHMRDVVEKGIPMEIKVVPGIIDWMTPEDAIDLVSQNFTELNLKDRIVCYSNPKVIEFNEFIRTDLRQLPHQYLPGEVLVSNSACKPSTAKGAPMLSIEEQVTIIEVDPNPVTHIFGRDEDGAMDVYPAKVENSFGEELDVFLPMDRNHYAALVKHYQKTKEWPTYFKLKEKYPDLRQRDASTVHKSQGSSYDTVYVDLENISTCHLPGMAARLFYVGFSRARKRVVLFGQLNPKFGKLIF